MGTVGSALGTASWNRWGGGAAPAGKPRPASGLDPGPRAPDPPRHRARGAHAAPRERIAPHPAPPPGRAGLAPDPGRAAHSHARAGPAPGPRRPRPGARATQPGPGAPPPPPRGDTPAHGVGGGTGRESGRRSSGSALHSESRASLAPTWSALIRVSCDGRGRLQGAGEGSPRGAEKPRPLRWPPPSPTHCPHEGFPPE